MAVNLNTCTYEELRSLPCIGEKYAQRIRQVRTSCQDQGKHFTFKDLDGTPSQLQTAISQLIKSGDVVFEPEQRATTPVEDEEREFRKQMREFMVTTMASLRKLTEEQEKYNRRFEGLEQRIMEQDSKLLVLDQWMAATDVKVVEEMMSASIKADVRPKVAPTVPPAEDLEEAKYIEHMAQVIKERSPRQPTPQEIEALNKAEESRSRSRSRNRSQVDERLNHQGPAEAGYSGSQQGGPGFRFYHPKLKFYDGKEDFYAFSVQFDMIANAQQWTDQQKLDHLLEYLCGDALFSFVHMGSEVRSSYGRAVTELSALYSQKITPEIKQAELNTIVQKEEETLDLFGRRIKQTVFFAFPGCETSTLETLSIQSFLRGCSDKVSAEIAMISSPRTLNELVEFTKVASSSCSLLQINKKRNVNFSESVRQIQEVPESADERATLTDLLSVMKDIQQKMTPFLNKAITGQPSSSTSSPTRSSSPMRSSSQSMSRC